MNRPLILASTSKYKISQLSKLGVPFTDSAHQFDEQTLRGSVLSPRELSLQLAQKKALSLGSAFKNSLILGADQVCAFNGEILSKPSTLDNSVNQLLKLQGNTHSLFTAIALVEEDKVIHSFVVEAKLTMHPLKESQIRTYLNIDEPFDCCGSYKIEENGIRLFKSITCEDYSAIIGLPLLHLGAKLRELQYDF